MPRNLRAVLSDLRAMAVAGRERAGADAPVIEISDIEFDAVCERHGVGLDERGGLFASMLVGADLWVRSARGFCLVPARVTA